LNDLSVTIILSLKREGLMDILTSRKEAVGYVSLNRIKQRNAISQSMWQRLPIEIEALVSSGARAIVLSGEQGVFSAGADLAELQAIGNLDDASSQWLSIYESLNRIASAPVPLIAKIDGPCMGGGCLLALACDLRYCTERSLFAVPVAQLGIVLDDDNVQRLVSVVGTAFAREILYRAATFDAKRAARIGLVNEVLSSIDAEVDAIATDISRVSAQSVTAAKDSILNAAGSAKWGLQNQKSVIASYLSEDFQRRMNRR
jgi:enoyl-CoA hydratase/carnithine racemase